MLFVRECCMSDSYGIAFTVEGGWIVGVWAQADEPERLGVKHVSAHGDSFHFIRQKCLVAALY